MTTTDRKQITDFQYEDEDGEVKVVKKAIKQLAVGDGDVIVLKRFDGLSMEMIDSFAERLGELGLHNTIIVVVEKLSDVRTLDAWQMGKMGWVKKDGTIDGVVIAKLLDQNITRWRTDKRDMAQYYIDAYQGLRLGLLGRILEEPDDDSS